MNIATGEPTERLYIFDVTMPEAFAFFARMGGGGAAVEVCKPGAQWLTVYASEDGNITLQRHEDETGAIKALRAALAAAGAGAAGTGHLSVDWIVSPGLGGTFRDLIAQHARDYTTGTVSVGFQ